jgi:hypothetical protein
MAIALTLGLDDKRSTAVKDYFNKFKTLPPKGLTVSNTKKLTGVSSLETLLKGIIAEKSETQFVLVVHGFDTGEGLILELATRGGRGVGAHTKHEMLQTLMDIDARTPPAPPPAPGKPAPKRPQASATAAERTKLGELTDAEINRLIDLMTQVRAKNITLVEFRGCNLGKLDISVDRFRKFLGAQTLGAPNLHSFFGTFPIKASAGIMSSHSATHGEKDLKNAITIKTFTYPTIFAGGTANCCIGTDTRRKPVDGHLVAPDTATLDAWIKANFNPAASSGTDTTLPIHGLWEFPAKPANDPNPSDPDPRPIFPLGTVMVGTPPKKQNEYSTRIKYKP